MRPASHMPLAEMITAPPRISFSAIDSSTSWTKRTRGRPPLPRIQSMASVASGSSLARCFSVISVAAVAIGEST